MILITTKSLFRVMFFFMKIISLFPKPPLSHLPQSYLSLLTSLMMSLPTRHLLSKLRLPLPPLQLPILHLRSLGDPLGRPSHLHTCVIFILHRLYRFVPLNHLNQRWCVPQVLLTPLMPFYLTNVSLTIIVPLLLLFPLHKNPNLFCRPCSIPTGVMQCVLRWML